MYVLGLYYWILTKYSLKDEYAAWNFFLWHFTYGFVFTMVALTTGAHLTSLPLPACVCKVSDVAMAPLENSD
jgi:cytochrome c oxidase assembly factor CtaG